jgi:hypothetical protein
VYKIIEGKKKDVKKNFGACLKLLLTQSIRKAALISTAAWWGMFGNNMGAIRAVSGVQAASRDLSNTNKCCVPGI